MMDSVFWIKAAQLVLSLAILIIMHEGGHFLAARMFGIRVEKFFLFFDYKCHLLSTKDKWVQKLFPRVKDWKTEYGIGWIPLGGYVKIAGMVDESMDLEQLKQPVQPWEFRAKPAWQRLIVMLGGVFVNFILAMVIYAGIIASNGTTTIPMDKNFAEGFEFNEYAESLGFADGDRLLKIDDRTIESYMKGQIIMDMAEAASVTVMRGDEEVIVYMPDEFPLLEVIELQPPFFTPINGTDIVYEHKEYGILEAIPEGITMGWETLKDYVGQLKYLFSKKGAQSVGSFATIGDIFPATWNWTLFWSLTAFISIILAFMNVLPIPGLDGGHAFFTLIEMITGYTFSEKFQERALNIGLTLILALMALAIFNDVLKFVFHTTW